MADQYAKPAATKEIKSINKSKVGESKADLESFTPRKAPEGGPSILNMLSNDNARGLRSPSLWWRYKHSTGKSSC